MTKEKNFHMKIDHKTDVFSSEVEKFGEEKSIRIAFWLNGFESEQTYTLWVGERSKKMMKGNIFIDV